MLTSFCAVKIPMHGPMVVLADFVSYSWL